ncbi:MarR family transcriptional regulator [Halostagnicola larsenii XH-48]|uniref:MarR family transcriptional regulator n=1 Tax=Halostagnicola larsenii XH-48 TaxID=797299 RepID=W0JLM2_9EURY|nr:transcriptional regulator [Halostagnicola larsenii]AHF99635.1 MarR family transcriptional regulator [Halostagnicola larsenii XH-48]
MDLDKLVHQPTRLQIFAYLYQHGESSFNDLTEDLDLTEGNLSSHLQRMEAADAVEIRKEFVDKRPRTNAVLTDEGEALFEDHVQQLQGLIDELE